MSRFNRKYLIYGTLLAIGIFAVSFLLFPEWRLDWRLLLVLAGIAIYAAVEFTANFRQAFLNEKVDDTGIRDQPGNLERSVSQSSNMTDIDGVQIRNSKAGRDINVALKGDIHTGGGKTRTKDNPTDSLD